MCSFWKRKASNIIVPDWASMFNQLQYEVFIKKVEAYFSALKVDVKWGDGIIEIPEHIMGVGQLGLVNLAQICSQADTRNYNDIVGDHFETMIKAHAFESEWKLRVGDYEYVSQYIGVRVYDNDYVAVIGKENTLGRDIGEDLYAMLIFDLPHSIINIKPAEIIPWNKTIDELFVLGIENIRTNYSFEIEEELINDEKFWVVHGDHFFTANIVFDTDKWKTLTGAHGALIGLPHRHTVLIYPINDLKVVNAINNLIPLIHYMNQKGPGSLTNKMYWLKDNEFISLPHNLTDNKIEFVPPDEFVNMLNTLKS